MKEFVNLIFFLFFQRHMEIHTCPDTLECEICGLGYATLAALRFHHTKKHPELVQTSWECGRCGKNLSDRETLKI